MKKEKMKKRISIVMASVLLLSVLSPGTVLAEKNENSIENEKIIVENEILEESGENAHILLNEENCMFYQDLESGAISIEVTIDRACDIIIPTQLGEYRVEKFGSITISGAGARRVILPYSVKEFPGYSSIVWGTCETVVIPEGITKIRNSMFSGSEIQYINLPYTIQEIDALAFYNCSKLVGVSLPAGVETIDNYAFSGCKKIKSFDIPNGVTMIGTGVFQGCESLEEINVNFDNKFFISQDGVLMNKDKTILITYPAAKADVEYIIPEGITFVSESAFSSNENLQKVSFPNSLVEIGGFAFLNCSQLSDIEIPESVDSIGWQAFDRTKYSENYVAETGNPLIYIGKWLVGCDWNLPMDVYDAYINEGTEHMAYMALSGRKWGIVQFPKSINKINNSVCYGSKDFFTGINTVIIPKTVTEIEADAFHRCYIEYINIPSSVTTISSDAFAFGQVGQILCEKGSYAEQYAKENNMAYSYVTNTVVKGAEDGKVELEYNPDSETNIGAKVSVTGMFAEGTSIEVTELDKESVASKAFAQTASEMKKMSVKMQMNISTDQEETSGNVHVKIPAGEEHNGETGYILHYKNDAVETYPITVTNGFAETDVTNLSPFALVLESNVMKGDVDNNGEINIVDLMMCLHHVSGSTLLEGDALVASDVDNSGEVEIVDLMRLLHFVSGSSSEL